MAKINLAWDAFRFPARDTQSWGDFNNFVNYDERYCASHDAVYVIRIAQPFVIGYGNDLNSPVIYIGRGRFKDRVTSHLTSWMRRLSAEFPYLQVEILACEPRVRNNYDAYMDVEAHLLEMFQERYGELPAGNENFPKPQRPHEYKRGPVTRALDPTERARFGRIMIIPSSELRPLLREARRV